MISMECKELKKEEVEVLEDFQIFLICLAWDAKGKKKKLKKEKELEKKLK